MDALSFASSTAVQFGYGTVAQSIELVRTKVLRIQQSPDPLKISSGKFHELSAELSVMLSRMEKAGVSLTECVADLQTCAARTAPSWSGRVVCTMTFVADIAQQFTALISRAVG